MTGYFSLVTDRGCFYGHGRAKEIIEMLAASGEKNFTLYKDDWPKARTRKILEVKNGVPVT